MSIANGFLRNFNSPVLSSEVGDLQFRTNHEYAEISVYGGLMLDAVYKERLYPDADGVCTAYQIGDLITQWMIDNGFSYREFYFSEMLTNTSVFVKILLSRFVSEDGFLYVSSHALMTSKYQVIPHDGKFRFHFFSESSSEAQRTVSLEVLGLTEEGSQSKHNMSLMASVKDGNICSLSLCPDVLMDKINQDLEVDEEISSISLISFKVPDSTKRASVSVWSDVDRVGFEFINQFGLMETLYLHAEVSPEVKVDVESAVVGHRNVQYDVEQSESFKVEASNISELLWRNVKTFLTSPEIYEASTGRRIFISEISQDPPKTYDSLGSLKFSFSYEDDRIFF